MRQALIVAVIVALAGGVIVAQQQAVAPRSPAARKALERRDYAVRKAEQEYRRALAEAHRTLIADLETAKAAAMKASQLDEANAIQAAIDAALAELDAAMGKTQARTFEIDAARNWQPTVEVRKGQTIIIRAKGTWTHYPARDPYDADGWPDQRNTDRRGALFGRIGDREFPVGKTLRFSSPATGTLELQMNDGDHSDNSGSLTVTIEVQ